MLPVLYRFPEWIPILGGQAVTSFGAALFAAFLFAGALFVRRLGDPDRGADTGGWELVVSAAVGGLIGANLLHLAISAALDLPTGAFGRAGLNWFGGLIGGAAAVFWHARRQGLDLARVAGAAAPALALGYAIGRIGSFMVGADYGLPTAAPWGLSFPRGTPPTTPDNMVQLFGAEIPPGARGGDFVWVHPTQLYEAGLALAILAVLETARRAGRQGWRLLGLFLILSAIARTAVELVRSKQDRLLGPITVDMVLALGGLAVGFVLTRRGRGRVQPMSSP